MRKSLLVLLTSAALLGGVPTLVYAETPTTAAPDAVLGRKMELVKRYFTAVRYDEMIDTMTKSMIPAMFEQMQKRHPDLTEEQGQAISDTIAEMMAEMMPYVKEQTVTLFAEEFTEEELTQMVAFYESPVGQSILTKSMAMMPRIMESLLEKMPDMQSRMMERLCARLDCGTEEPAAPSAPSV